MVGDMGCVCPLPKGKVPCVGVALSSHLLSLASRTVTIGSQSPGGQLYGWLPLSNAYGISSLATQRKIKRLRHFHSLRTKHVLPDFRIRQYETIYL